MANAKITALTALTTAENADVLAIVDDPAGSPVTKKITVKNLHTIVNSVAAEIPFSIQGHASQSANLFDILDSNGVSNLAFEAAGAMRYRHGGLSFIFERYANDTAAGTFIGRKSRNATVGSHTIVQSGDAVFQINFAGSDGAAFRNLARISGEVDGTPGSSDMPGRLVFLTTTDGGITLTERLRIDNAGDFTFFDGADFILGTSTGTMIGTTTTQKLGFYGATPIVKGSAFTQTYSTASHTHAAITASNPPAGGTGATAGAYDTAANRNLMITSLTNNIADVANVKQVLNGLIDDLQALGLIA